MQELSSKFDSFRQEVDSLKKQQQKESSPAQSSWTTSETDSSSSGDEQDERHDRDKGKRKASRSRANLSRSRHRSRSRRGERRTRSRSRSGTNRRSLTWGERIDHPENEVMDYTEDINFHDSGDEEVDCNFTGEDQKLCEVSEKTRVLLVQACSKRAPNSIRRKVRCPYPLPRSQPPGPHSWMRSSRQRSQEASRQQTRSWTNLCPGCHSPPDWRLMPKTKTGPGSS